MRRAAGPGVFLLGCGLPVGPGVGTVHAARVSADAGPQWLPMANDKHNIPGARNMLRNAVRAQSKANERAREGQKGRRLTRRACLLL